MATLVKKIQWRENKIGHDQTSQEPSQTMGERRHPEKKRERQDKEERSLDQPL